MKRLLLAPLFFISLNFQVIAGINDAEIKGLGWGRGFKEASSSFEIRCGEGESKTICNLEFLDRKIKVNGDYIPKTQIIHYWRNHDIWGGGKVTDHIYIKFLDNQGKKRIIKFILINKRDASEVWNLLNDLAI